MISPGVPLSSPAVAQALRQGVPALSELAYGRFHLLLVVVSR